MPHTDPFIGILRKTVIAITDLILFYIFRSVSQTTSATRVHTIHVTCVDKCFLVSKEIELTRDILRNVEKVSQTRCKKRALNVSKCFPVQLIADDTRKIALQFVNIVLSSLTMDKA